MKNRVILAAILLLLVSSLILPVQALAIPTMLNTIPTPDVVAHNNLSLMANYYFYKFTTPQLYTNSMIYSMEYGYKKTEFGFDYVANKTMVENGGYCGPTSWNFKWRILTQGSDPVSLAVGSFSLGSKSYNNQIYGASPYIVVSKAFTDCRLHIGYQMNIFGNKEVDTDNKKNNGILLGVDGVIVKSEKHPLTLYVDYNGGPLATLGIGVFQPITPKWSWFYSFYKPIKSTLPVSGGELAKQHWVGVSYTIPLK